MGLRYKNTDYLCRWRYFTQASPWSRTREIVVMLSDFKVVFLLGCETWGAEQSSVLRVTCISHIGWKCHTKTLLRNGYQSNIWRQMLTFCSCVYMCMLHVYICLWRPVEGNHSPWIWSYRWWQINNLSDGNWMLAGLQKLWEVLPNDQQPFQSTKYF